MFSSLASAHISQTGKLYFHEMFPFLKTLLINSVMSEGPAATAILLFLIPDQREGASKP